MQVAGENVEVDLKAPSFGYGFGEFPASPLGDEFREMACEAASLDDVDELVGIDQRIVEVAPPRKHFAAGNLSALQVHDRLVDQHDGSRHEVALQARLERPVAQHHDVGASGEPCRAEHRGDDHAEQAQALTPGEALRLATAATQ